MDILEQYVHWVDTRLSRSTRASGIDAPYFKVRMIWFGKASANLQMQIEQWPIWISNGSPPWEIYCNLMSGSLVYLDNCTVVITMVTGEVFWILLVNIILYVGGYQENNAQVNVNICAFLKACKKREMYVVCKQYNMGEINTGQVSRRLQIS